MTIWGSRVSGRHFGFGFDSRFILYTIIVDVVK